MFFLGLSLFRSAKNGRLYWMGNLCAAGERARGNSPRSPLFIGEVQEQPFALKQAADLFKHLITKEPSEKEEKMTIT